MALARVARLLAERWRAPAAAAGESAFVAGRPLLAPDGVAQVINTVVARQGQT